MTDYISKKGIQKALIGLPADLDAKTVQRCIETVHNFPAADVRENVRGEWINTDRCHVRCSNCKHEYHDSIIGVALFCPRCGAIMNGGI